MGGGEQSSIAVAVGSPRRLCGEWDQGDGWGRDREVQGCFETSSYFSLFSPLPIRALQISALGAVCVRFLMLEAARGARAHLRLYSESGDVGAG